MAQLMLIHNCMYGTHLPHPGLVGREANLDWLPEAWRPTAAAALGQEYP